LGRDRLADRLRVESLLPEDASEQVVTIMSHLAADEFPQEPLALCQHDVVVIAGDVFAALRSGQLEALLKWVTAGGSLFLEPAGILDASHLDFLNHLVADDSRNLVFSLDDKGRLPREIYFGEGRFLRFDCGLGVVVFHEGADPANGDDDEWRGTAAALWKFRPGYETLVRDGRFLNNTPFGMMQAAGVGAISEPFAGPPLGELIDLLSPRGVRMVPLWVIGALLGSLVVLIGPVDYFTLSWLKRRKWTWITFPGMVVVVTGLTMAITNAYLSTAETRRAFVIHDVGAEGEIVRTNRLELIFPASTRRIVSDVQGSLFTPLMTGGQMDPRYNRAVASQRMPYYGAVPTSEPAFIQGRMPTRYKASQDVRQWTPQLNRWFSIGPPANRPAIDWNFVRVPDVQGGAWLRTNEVQQEFHAMMPRLFEQFGRQVQAAVLSAEGIVWQNLSHSSHNHLEIVRRLTIAEQPGISGLMSHTSPHGGRTLDDVSLTKCCNSDRWWLVILVPEGDDLVVYRKSYAYSQ
jgi:hypothetical protein